MAEMFSTLGTWNWLIFGFILMALELLAPGVFLFWLGLAALLVGLLSFAINPSWQTQLLMFAVFAVAAVPVWRRFARSASSRQRQQPVPQQAHRGAGRPGVHAGKADHRRLRHGADRRHDLARRRSRCAGRQPGQDRAGRRRQPDGGGGVDSRPMPSLAPALGKAMQRQESFEQLLAQLREADSRRRARVRRGRPRAVRSAAPAARSARPRRRRCAARARSAAASRSSQRSARSSAGPADRAAP